MTTPVQRITTEDLSSSHTTDQAVEDGLALRLAKGMG